MHVADHDFVMNLQSFYTKTRRLCVHYKMLDDKFFDNIPTTLEEWQKIESTKMKALIEILQYHMKSPDRPPLKIADIVDEVTGETIKDPDNTLVPVTDHVPDNRVDKERPDKIIVYSAYPFHNERFLIPVCAPCINIIYLGHLLHF